MNKILLYLLFLGLASNLKAQDMYSPAPIILPQAPATTYVIQPGKTITVTSAESITLLPGAQLQAGANITLRIGTGNPADNTDMNWVLSRSYDEEGRVIGESKAFFDDNGKSLQTQAKNVVTGQVLATQTIYDGQGRAAINTLPAPIDYTGFRYKPDFVTTADGKNYNYLNFEDAKINTPDPLGNNVFGTLGWYYSKNNNLEPYIGTTQYPFGQTDFYNDGSGAIKRAAGPGDELRMGKGREAWAFNSPVLAELSHYKSIRDKFFPVGTAGQSDALTGRALQTVTSDADGTENVSITDLSGNVLMQARAATATTPVGEVLTVSNSFKLIKQAPFEYYFKGDEAGDYAVNLTVKGGNIKIYESTDGGVSYTEIYNGPASQYSSKPGYIDLYKIDSEQSFTVSYSVVPSMGPTMVMCDDCPSQLAAPGKSQLFYFKLLQAGPVTLSTTNWQILDMQANGAALDFTSGNTLPTGYYKVVPTDNAPLGEATLTYSNKFTGISYNFYNQLGQVIASLAPKGVQQLLPTASINNYGAAANVPFINLYEYDLQGRLTAVTEPDAGRTEYVYRKDGQIRFSRQAEQAKVTNGGTFSYTNYDRWGRAVESGEYVGTTPFTTAQTDATLQESIANDGGLSGTKRHWVRTYYDTPNSTHGLSGYQQDEAYLKGAVSRTENENTKTWYSYDSQGRLTWTIQELPNIGKKTVDYTYDMLGNVLTVTYQKNTPTERFTHYYTYDQAKRLTQVHTNRSLPTEVTAAKDLQAQYYYYLHGPLKRVELANNLQGIDYIYTVQGWLKSLNHTDKNLDPGRDGQPGGPGKKDLFGLTLDYFSGDYVSRALTAASTSTANLGTGYKDSFTGLIKSASWQSSLQSQAYTHAYQYDVRNWLLEANMGNRISGNFVLSPTGAYKEHIINESNGAYDANGNLQGLIRTNKTGVITDNFFYQYTSNSNKLNTVTQNGATVLNYTYDALGQLTHQHDEQGDEYLTYDVAGKVTGVYRDAARTQPKVTFAYDDKGFRVKKTSYDAAGTTPALTTWYVNDASGNPLSVYTQEATQPITQTKVPIYGAGRVGAYTLTRNQTWEGRYELTDYLGNVRVVFRKPIYDTKRATLEYGVAVDEEAHFQNLLRTRRNDASRTGSYAARLNAQENTPIGPLRTLTVQKGDSIQALAYGHYTPVQNNSFLFDLGSFLASSFVFKLSEPTATEDPNGQKRNIMPYVGASFALSQAVRNTLPAGVPEAYLKYIAYDKDWKVVASGEKTISTIAQQAWEELRLGYEAQQDGYVEVFVANGNGTNVYFDDIQVKHGQGMVVQENHYYAFGKEIPELHYLNGASKSYRNAYQGQFAEKDEETGYNNFELRMYDSRIGRWLSTDPYRQYASPYVGMGNDPINSVDPDGGFNEYGVDNNTGEVKQLSTLGGDEVDIYHFGQWVEFNGKPAFTANHTTAIDRIQGGNTNGSNINVFRMWQTPQSTISTFHIPGKEMNGFIMEPKGPTPKGYLKSNTRLPAGTYSLTSHNTSKYPDTFRLYNNIAKLSGGAYLIHKGSLPEHTRGCLMPGTAKGVNQILGSKSMTSIMKRYINETGVKNIKINIYDAFN
jgi:RHS repeat-associated protein